MINSIEFSIRMFRLTDLLRHAVIGVIVIIYFTAGLVSNLTDPCKPPYPCTLDRKNLMANPDDCSQYFVCAKNPNLNEPNRWLSQQCADGELFDYIIGQCMNSTQTVHCQPSCSSALVHTIVISPRQPVEDGQLQFNCSFRIDMFPQQVQVEDFTWILNGLKLTSSGPRLQTALAGLDVGGTWVSTLTFNPVLPQDSGIMECNVDYGIAYRHSVFSPPYHVIPRPSVVIQPLSGTVYLGDNITITCQASSNDQTTSLSLEWLQNGLSLNTSDVGITVVIVSAGESVTVYPTENVVFSCRAHKVIGDLFSAFANSTITVIQDTTTPVCEEDLSAGIIWPLTMANTTSTQACLPPTIGRATRLCMKLGNSILPTWLAPDTSQCVNQLLVQLLNTVVNQLQQGVGVDNATVVSAVSRTLQNFTSTFTQLSVGDLRTAISVITGLAAVRSTQPGAPVSRDEVQAITTSISNILRPANNMSWMSMLLTDSNSAVVLMKALDTYGNAWARQLSPGQSDEISTDNIILQVYQQYQSNIASLIYPRKNATIDPEWLASSTDVIIMPQAAITSSNSNSSNSGIVFNISSTYYRNLNQYLPVNA